MSGRKDYIDVARGIGILLVVLGHSIGNIDDPVNRFILSFHMPLFFFLSGLVSNDDNPDTVTTFLRKKAYALLIPQMVFAVFHIIFRSLLVEREFSKHLIKENILSWFLIVMFYVTIIFWCLVRSSLIKYKRLILSVTVILLLVISALDFHTVTHLEIVPMAFLFYFIAYCIRPYLENSKGGFDIRHYNLGGVFHLWVFAIPVIVIISYWNKPVLMYINQYGNIGLFYLPATLGIWVTFNMAVVLERNRVLKFFGRNSLIVYIFHDILLSIMHGIGSKMWPQIAGSNYLYPAYWHYFSFAILGLVPIIFICNRWFWFLFGKKHRDDW